MVPKRYYLANVNVSFAKLLVVGVLLKLLAELDGNVKTLMKVFSQQLQFEAISHA